jgi:hypothetical protein
VQRGRDFTLAPFTGAADSGKPIISVSLLYQRAGRTGLWLAGMRYTICRYSFLKLIPN